MCRISCKTCSHRQDSLCPLERRTLTVIAYIALAVMITVSAVIIYKAGIVAEMRLIRFGF